MTQQRLEARPLGAQPAKGAADLAGQKRYLTMAEFIVEYRFDVTAPKAPRLSAWQFLKRNAPAAIFGSRRILIDRERFETIVREGI